MTHAPVDDAGQFGISEMANLAGLSKDTLRWYEREGMLPDVPRGPTGYRTYTGRVASLVILLSRLRATGMPTADMRLFAQLVGQGAASHGRRVAVLEAHRVRIAEQQQRLAEASEALEGKLAHYEHLIAHGLDCDGAPIDIDTRTLQETR